MSQHSAQLLQRLFRNSKPHYWKLDGKGWNIMDIIFAETFSWHRTFNRKTEKQLKKREKGNEANQCGENISWLTRSEWWMTTRLRLSSRNCFSAHYNLGRASQANLRIFGIFRPSTHEHTSVSLYVELPSGSLSCVHTLNLKCVWIIESESIFSLQKLFDIFASEVRRCCGFLQQFRIHPGTNFNVTFSCIALCGLCDVRTRARTRQAIWPQRFEAAANVNITVRRSGCGQPCRMPLVVSCGYRYRTNRTQIELLHFLAQQRQFCTRGMWYVCTVHTFCDQAIEPYANLFPGLCAIECVAILKVYLYLM